MEKLDSDAKTQILMIFDFWWLRWFYELCEFELKEFSCKGLLVNSEGTEEVVQFRWSFELQEFELHEFNCIVKAKVHPLDRTVS